MAAVVERFNRTLKSRMWPYSMHINTYIYIDVLQELVSVYNASPRQGVGMALIEVNYCNQLKIWNKYYSQGVNRKPFNFGIGNHVRISRDKGVFANGYVQSWSEEHFVIESRLCRTPNVYVLRDLSGEPLQSVFFKNNCKGLKLQTSSPFLVLYENRVKEHSWSGEVGLINSTVGSF